MLSLIQIFYDCIFNLALILIYYASIIVKGVNVTCLNIFLNCIFILFILFKLYNNREVIQ